MKTISRFHYITQDLESFTHAALAELACRGGAEWIQLRVKNKSYDEWKKIALEVRAICKKYVAKLIINDHVQIAEEIEADGVHLGKEDMSVDEAKKSLGEKFIIGGTANTRDEVKRLIEEGVDYIGLGPFRFTTTKEKLSPVLGLEGIRHIVGVYCNKPVQIPMIVIGGIQLENVESLMQTGIHGIAVSSAINKAVDKTETVKEFLRQIVKPGFFS